MSDFRLTAHRTTSKWLGGLLLMGVLFGFSSAAFAQSTCSTFNAPCTTAQNNLSCAGYRWGSALGCTAKEFVVNPSIQSDVTGTCLAGTQISPNLNLQLVFSGANTVRYNVGIFFGESGNAPDKTTTFTPGNGTDTCSVATFPPPNSPFPPWQNLDSATDSCNDFYPQGTPEASYAFTESLYNVKVKCLDVDGNGKLDVPYTLVYQQASGGACTGPQDVSNGTVSKCDANMAEIPNISVTATPVKLQSFDVQ